MGDLKPLGSEKLQGQEKINRIIEISRYNENKPISINETSRTEYNISLSDGNEYGIVKERLGYVIKRAINESESEYIEPMKNRKYYSSYGQALKRLNLLTKEVNRLTENEEGTSLFGEQKKYTLKTPNKSTPDMSSEPMPAAPAEPPSVPSPELPPSPESAPPPAPEQGMPDMGELGGDEPMPDMGDLGGDTSSDNGEEVVTFKTIQKLTGRLTQKLREFDNEKGLTSENIKYVVNMVLSAVDLKNLSDEDKEDIMSKFEEEEGMEGMGDEEMGGDDMGDMTGDEMGSSTPDEMGTEEPLSAETTESMGDIFDSIFGESKVDKVISKYFDISQKEKKEKNRLQLERKLYRDSKLNTKMKEIKRFTETIEQEWASENFLKENINFNFVGKTNKNNLLFENKNKQIKISPEGNIL